jgi:hypothetical protein
MARKITPEETPATTAEDAPVSPLTMLVTDDAWVSTPRPPKPISQDTLDLALHLIMYGKAILPTDHMDDDARRKLLRELRRIRETHMGGRRLTVKMGTLTDGRTAMKLILSAAKETALA